MKSIRVDLHLHSMASGHAFNTIDEIVAHAKKHEYDLIGISDHGPQMEGAPHCGYFEMLYRLPKQVGDLRVLYGCEANIINDSGVIDLPPKLLGDFDFVIAGLHKRTPYKGVTAADHTRAIVSAIASGWCDIISHPVSLNFATDVGEIVQAAAAEDAMLEANKSVMLNALCGSAQWVIDATRTLFSEARAAGVAIIFGSDAHHISEMDISDTELLLMERVYGLDFAELVNGSPADILAFLDNRKKARRHKSDEI